MTSKVPMIRLRKIEKNDAAHRASLLNQPEISNNVFIDIPISNAATESWCQAVSSSDARVDFVVVSNDEQGDSLGYAGLVNINYRHGVCELYIFISPKCHGKSFGSLAIKSLLSYAKIELGLRKIKLFISEPNERLHNFYLKNGFKKEGTLVQDVWFRGRYVDRGIYSYFLSDCSNSDLLVTW